MKFLVIRFSSIGDIVLASPVLRCLRKQVPTAELHFLTRRSFSAVTEANPYVTRFHYYDGNLSALIRELRQEDFDYVIDLQRNLRSARIRRALGKPSIRFQKLSFRKTLLTQFGINRMPGRHITLRSMDTLAGFGVQYDGAGLDYFIPDKDRVTEKDIPAAHHAGYIALVIGASYATKKLPPQKLQELCRLIDHPIILLGGPEDAAIGAFVASVDPVKIYNACGKFTLNESADLVRRAKLVVSHDTGLQYIACAFQRPVLAVWGATSPALDVEPFYPNGLGQKPMHENIIRQPPLKCQPCSRYGSRQCPLGHFKCMLEMDMPQLAAKVHFWLGR